MKNIYKVKHLGQVFTPKKVVKKMLSLRKNNGSILEPACGDGSFLNQLENTAVGIEIDKNIIEDPRVLFTDFFSYSLKNKFESIIGNPPYVRFQDIEENTKKKLNMSLFDQRTNLYLFFIKKCIEHLSPKGELILITPRDFIKSTSSMKLNELLYKEGSISHFYDLGDQNIFKDFSPNCAIWRWIKAEKHKKLTDGRRFSCKNGQLLFGEQKEMESINDYFDVRVGAVSGADNIFTSSKGNKKFVCSTTVKDKELRTMIYNKKDRTLNKHKQTLLQRRIRKFDESNWWEWGRKYHEKEGERIYVNCKTRNPNPFFQSDVMAYDGSILALFPKKKINLSKAVEKLNQTDWNKKGFVCGGRLIFSQRSLQNSPIDFFL